MDVEEQDRRQAFAQGEKWRNAEWALAPGPDGTLSPEDVTHALLIDVRGTLHQIRGMMRFFVVLAVIGLAIGLLSVLLK